MSFMHGVWLCRHRGAGPKFTRINACGGRPHRGLRFALERRWTMTTKRNATEEGVFMKRHLMLGTVFSAALAVGAAAQSQPPSQSPPSQPPTSQSPTSQSPTSQDTSRSSGTITVTGCLKADTSSPSAAPGAAGAPA